MNGGTAGSAVGPCRPGCHLPKALLWGGQNRASTGVQTEAGFDPYEKKLLGITAMSSLLGKKQFDELLGGLVYKPPGKPALVPESDKRPAMNTATDDFKDN